MERNTEKVNPRMCWKKEKKTASWAQCCRHSTLGIFWIG